MRILALRGENLASLRRFDVDLDGPILGGTGLFAITGSTGSGKSTLLDATCVALYDRTPRLGARSGVKVGAKGDPANLTGTDVRGLLRRGAGQGHAEVEFIGGDGVRYRARWSVHRARGRADGRFQPQRVELFDVDHDRDLTSDRKTETLDAIEAAVGLSFDQFRRSVLLAQNEFDAFLRATVKQRGELLERMTGTELYRRLSSAAHQRASEASDRLELSRAQAEALVVLGPAARSTLEARTAEATAWRAAARERLADVEEATRWYQARAERHAAEEKARERVAAADAEWTAAEAVRSELTAVQAVAPLRALVCDRDEAAAANQAARASRTGRVAESTRAVEAATAAESELAQAVSAQGTAHAALEGARPDLERARTLDAELDRGRAAAGEARGRVKRAARDAGQSTLEAEQVAARLTGERAALRDAQAWLERHEAFGHLAEQWPRWAAELERLADAEGRLTELRRDAAEAEAEAAAVEAHVAEASARREGAREALDAARAQVEVAEAAASQHPEVSAQAVISRQTDLLGRLNSLGDRAREASRLVAEIGGAEESTTAAKSERKRQRRRAREAGKRATRYAAELAKAEAVLGKLDLEALRAALEPGEPCPVCGSTEHPGVMEAVATASDTLSERVSTLRARLGRVESDGAAAEAAEASAAEREADAVARLAGRRQQLAQLRTDWEMTRLGLGDAAVPEDPLDPKCEAAIRADQERVHAAQAEAHAALATARSHEAANVEARAALDAARARLDEAEAAFDAAGVAERALREKRRGAEAEEAVLEAAREAAREALDAPLAAHSEWPADDIPGFAEARGDEVTRWKKRVKRRDDADAAIDEVNPRVVSLRARAAQHHAEAARIKGEQREINDRVEGLEAERAGLLDGRKPGSVEQVLKLTLAVAEGRLARGRTDAGEAGQARSAAEARSIDAEAAVERTADGARVAEQALGAALEAAEVDLDTVRQRLMRSVDWVDGESARIATLAAERQRAAAVLKARSADRETVEQAEPPAWAEAEVAAALEAAAEAVEAFESGRTALYVELQADDHARAARDGLAPEISEREAAHLTWGRLDELIGAADGSRFREFAQSLTLDAVVEQANHHLDDLARRYRLMRVPGEDLDLQVVDREMGDEIRGVQSLSGGESFLVSLALALGLASLSARETRIDSLFIDEGFGSLDPEALEIALSTLDSLQAGGRQVGIISHVESLGERVGARVCVEPVRPGVSRVVTRPR